MSLSLSSYLSLCASLSLSSRGHHWIVRVMSFPNLYFMWVAVLKSLALSLIHIMVFKTEIYFILECGCLSTSGLQRDEEEDEDEEEEEEEEKTTVRLVPDGSDKKWARGQQSKRVLIQLHAIPHPQM